MTVSETESHTSRYYVNRGIDRSALIGVNTLLDTSWLDRVIVEEGLIAAALATVSLTEVVAEMTEVAVFTIGSVVGVVSLTLDCNFMAAATMEFVVVLRSALATLEGVAASTLMGAALGGVTVAKLAWVALVTLEGVAASTLVGAASESVTVVWVALVTLEGVAQALGGVTVVKLA